MPAKTAYVRPDVANLLAMMAANPGPSFTDMSPAEGRAMYNAMGQMLELPRGEISSTDLALPGGVKARLYTPAALEDGSVVAYYHGGGWVIGDLDTHDPLCAEIARALGRPDAEARFESKGLDFHRRLRAGFLAIASAEPDRCRIVDASGDPDAVEARVLAAAGPVLGLGKDLGDRGA